VVLPLCGGYGWLVPYKKRGKIKNSTFSVFLVSAIKLKGDISDKPLPGADLRGISTENLRKT